MQPYQPAWVREPVVHLEAVFYYVPIDIFAFLRLFIYFFTFVPRPFFLVLFQSWFIAASIARIVSGEFRLNYCSILTSHIVRLVIVWILIMAWELNKFGRSQTKFIMSASVIRGWHIRDASITRKGRASRTKKSEENIFLGELCKLVVDIGDQKISLEIYCNVTLN